jgi:hypothetical protein
MKTSWNNTEIIGQYLSGKMRADDALVFEANLLIDPLLRTSVFLQKKIFDVVKLYGRKKLKAEIEKVHNHLFESPDKIIFQERIYQLFKKQ